MIRFDLIDFDENGQGTFNFEALEVRTNKKFVDVVVSQMASVTNNIVCCISNVVGTTVVLTDEMSFLFVVLRYNSRKDVIIEDYVTKHDIASINEYLEGVI